ncbi:hypothetical protein N0V93_001831 [Gnomoniopsis smithogilvyi]|uniref:Uncharacterized protein n=1 Tax=Gnomoniopsis smithogilvyi TaxID=1191159 RepID=A0A9W8Z4P7_9PEZI|nr:hypothetical protein N0V93_001831 [Gnomoniopsis smithogilvyi]
MKTHFAVLLLAASVRASLFGFPPQKPLGSLDEAEGEAAQWSNTIFPNGHTLAAVEIPAYTLLYHGLISPEEENPEPPSPEWLAFDLEMAYGIMGSARNSFLLTYQTTRPVKALYFDGESATLMGLGQMDTQMLQLFGNVTGPADAGRGFGLGAEYLRAHGLCNWLEEAGLRGRGWGFEGVVRMNAGFEMIWCDFVSPSLRLVSRVNVTAPLLPEDDDDDDDDNNKSSRTEAADADVVDGMDDLARRGGGVSEAPQATSYYPLPPQPTKTDRNAEPSHPAAPPNMRWDLGREPFLKLQGWGWFDSATWHYGSTRNGPGQGEVRAKVLNCGIMSYYSPRFVNQTGNRALDEQKSLNLTSDGLWSGPGKNGNRTTALKQLARRRRFHHLGDVTPEEALVMRYSTNRALKSLLGENACSGADWMLITSEIVSRVTNQLTLMDASVASFPANSKNKTETYKWLFNLRATSHLPLVPYLEYPEKIDRSTWSTDTAFYKETQSRCRYRYTRLLVPEELGGQLTPEEKDVRSAIEEVYGTICSVLITMHFEIELAWLDMIADGASESKASSTLSTRASRWQNNISELTAWLGWESQYYGCQEQCAWDERCYIPMWPLMHWGGMGKGPGRGPGGRRPGNGTHDRPGRGRGPGGGREHALGNDDDMPPPPPDHDGPGHGGPGFKMPPRGPAWMGDDTDLWEPKCVNISFIMGER